MLKKKPKKKRQTIGVMTQNRGSIPPPTIKDVVKKKKNDRRKMKQKLKRGEYDE